MTTRKRRLLARELGPPKMTEIILAADDESALLKAEFLTRIENQADEVFDYLNKHVDDSSAVAETVLNMLAISDRLQRHSNPSRLRAVTDDISTSDAVKEMPDEIRQKLESVREDVDIYEVYEKDSIIIPDAVMAVGATALLFSHAFNVIDPMFFCIEQTMSAEEGTWLVDHILSLDDNTKNMVMKASDSMVYLLCKEISTHQGMNIYPYFTEKAAFDCLQCLMLASVPYLDPAQTPQSNLQMMLDIKNESVPGELLKGVLEMITEKNVLEDNEGRKVLAFASSDLPAEVLQALEALFGKDDGNSSPA